MKKYNSNTYSTIHVVEASHFEPVGSNVIFYKKIVDDPTTPCAYYTNVASVESISNE
jgi:hypothetical protein